MEWRVAHSTTGATNHRHDKHTPCWSLELNSCSKLTSVFWYWHCIPLYKMAWWSRQADAFVSIPSPLAIPVLLSGAKSCKVITFILEDNCSIPSVSFIILLGFETHLLRCVRCVFSTLIPPLLFSLLAHLDFLPIIEETFLFLQSYRMRNTRNNFFIEDIHQFNSFCILFTFTSLSQTFIPPCNRNRGLCDCFV